MKYQHLTHDNRITIAGEIMRGTPVAAIAKAVGCHKATIYREIKRNRWKRCHYEGHKADNMAARRRAKASALPRKLKDALLRQVLAKMKIGWSPDVIAGRMGGISARAIYDYLHREQRAPSHHRPHRYLVKSLSGVPPWCWLKVGLGKYRKRGKPLIQPAMRHASPIRERPAQANARTEAGHYEADTAMVRGGAMVFMVCRQTRYVLSRLLKEKNGKEVARAMTTMLAGYQVKTITSDRGSEFARYRQVEEQTGARWYVCAPRRPDQRGSIEGIIRQMRFYYPRRLSANDITPSRLAADVRRLNGIPRKSLNYKTPAEMMAEMTSTPIPI